MRRIRLWLCCLVWLALAQSVRAQAFVPLAAADGSAGFVSLAPAGPSNSGLFQAANPTLSSGNVGGRGVTNVGNVQIGFDYIRPFWSNRDFMLAVPAASAGAFPLLGDVGHVDDHFGLAPIIRYKYDVEDIGLSFKATGTFLNLTGSLERRLSDNAGGQGVLTATSSLTIVTANLPEVSTRLYWDELFTGQSHLHNWSCFDDLIIDLGVGTRYSSIQQSYTGTLTNSAVGGTNTSTRYSTQNFKGLGITSSVDFTLPVKQNWVVFTNFRGSVLVGDNDKESTITVNLVGVPGTSSTINQNRTEFIPIGEIEIGTQVGYDLGQRLRDGLPPPAMTLRVAGTCQYWHNVGPLSAGSSQGFATSNLYLVGAHIMVGFHR